ncbi:MAG: P-loop NTPase [Caldimicrobium sp.]|nr:P-loop NTPase [Caldimicrobium sp.]MCX7873425.1 P-loop NTPase [Caldimicrobium sp.]MDW8094403.1 P-loop NTPase [Caldimicrobium sp.]
MKIAICGKGGVGKSSIATLLILAFLERGYKVLAIDADPSPHLARLLEIPMEITPLAEMMDLLAERAQKVGPYYTLNPKIDDLPERFTLTKDGLRLMVLGAIRTAGGGCACPEQTVLRRLLTYLLLTSKEVVLVDMEAGVEHFGRATVAPVDALLVITQPFKGSIETAKQIVKFSRDLGIKRVFVLGNRVKSVEQEMILKGEFQDSYLLSFPQDEELERREIEGMGLWNYRGILFKNAQELQQKLVELLHETT